MFPTTRWQTDWHSISHSGIYLGVRNSKKTINNERGKRNEPGPTHTHSQKQSRVGPRNQTMNYRELLYLVFL